MQLNSSNSYKCRICQRILSAKQKSTYTLKRHLEAKHPTWTSNSSANSSDKNKDTATSEDIGEHSGSSIPRKSIQGTLGDFVQIQKPLNSSAKTNIDKKLLKVFCNHALPFQLVEAQDFKDLVKTLCPSYNLPARKTLSIAMILINLKTIVFVILLCPEFHQNTYLILSGSRLDTFCLPSLF